MRVSSESGTAKQRKQKIKGKHEKIMSVILINYTYVHDVMRIWQGPEARPDSEFIFPERRVMLIVSRFKESRLET